MNNYPAGVSDRDFNDDPDGQDIPLTPAEERDNYSAEMAAHPANCICPYHQNVFRGKDA